MFGQMTAGSWIYIGTQGILQGTYQTFAAAGEQHFGASDLRGRTILTAGLGGMGGAQPLAATHGGRGDPLRRGRPVADRAASRDAVPRPRDGLARRGARARSRRPPRKGGRSRSACSATPPRSFPSSPRRGEHFDLVTDQTAAHDPLDGYVPVGLSVEEAAALRASDPDEYLRRARESIARHVEGMLEYVRAGSYVFDYGNNLRGEAYEAGVTEAFSYPGFVPAYIRPLFCRGIGPFRWAALSGDEADIATIDARLKELFPDDDAPPALARARAGASPFPGPARADLLARARRPCARRARDQRARADGQGEGAGRHRPRPPRLGLGRLAVPRDRGDEGRLRRDRRLADPERARQRRRRRDVGQRAPRRRRRDRELDPCGHGRRRRRHRRDGRAPRTRADDRSGDRASSATPTPATRRRSRPPRSTASSRRCRSRAASELGARRSVAAARPRPRAGRHARRAPRRRCAARDLGAVEVVEDAFVLCDDGRDRRSGADARPRRRSTATSRSSTGAGCARSRASSTATRTRASRATASGVLAARGGASYEELHAAGGGILVDRRGDASGRRGRAPRGGAAASRVDARARARRRSRPSRATGSTATPSSRRCARSRPRAASRPGSARMRFRPSSTTPTRISTSRSPRSCRKRRR